MKATGFRVINHTDLLAFAASAVHATELFLLRQHPPVSFRVPLPTSIHNPPDSTHTIKTSVL
jgi:hypothetical protein